MAALESVRQPAPDQPRIDWESFYRNYRKPGYVPGFEIVRIALPIAVAGFLLQHAVQGWCPPVPVMRRLGFRTEREIDAERTALKALRGDFREINPARPWRYAQRALRAAWR